MDCTLSSLITAHKILDTNEDVEIDLITTAFEVGMYGENPRPVASKSLAIPKATLVI